MSMRPFVFNNELFGTYTSNGGQSSLLRYTENPIELLASLADPDTLPRKYAPTTESLESGGAWVVVDRARGMDAEGIKTETR